MKYINRIVEQKLGKIKGHYPVILVTGPRQSGKSTVLNYFTSKANNINTVTLDNMQDRIMAQEDPELFLRSHGTPLIIDEFQYAPKLLSYIKIMVDNARKDELFNNGSKLDTLYYLTGSQVFETMQDVSESLAGRVAILDLFPLSTREIKKNLETEFIPDIDLLKNRPALKKESTNKLFERIFRGSYPELYKDPDIDVETYYSSYLRTYIERDIRRITNIRDEIKFMKFITSIAARTSQEYNALDIAEDVGVSSETIDSWVSILTNTYIISLLQPHSNNNVSRAIKRPKIYFMDTGLACYLTGYISPETLEKSAYSGAIFETYVVTEIIKSYANNMKDYKKHLYYYRDNNQKEIDLLVVNEDNIYPVEIKKNANPGSEAIKNFNIVDKFEMNYKNGIVLCMASDIRNIDDKNYIVPIEYI